MRNSYRSILIILIILSSAASGSVFAESNINYESGVYSDNIFVTVNDFNNVNEIYYSFGDNSNDTETPYQGGLLLSALPGEEREYRLNLKIDGTLYSYKYIIDKRPPEAPVSDYISDESGSGYVFETEKNAEIFYGYGDYKSDTVYKWSGEKVKIPGNDFIYFYAQDEAGNRSKSKLLLPEEQNAAEGRIELNIKSPVEGVYSNTQLLYLEKKNFEWIKYSLNNEDPEVSGSFYKMPVEIRRYGTVTLKIAAKPLNSDRIIRKEITYRVNTRPPLKNIPPSGVYSGSINIKSNLSGYRYCLADRVTGPDDPFFKDELNINPVYGGVKYSIIRFNNDEEEGDFRYFYVIDDRVPANPIIECSSLLPEENIVEVNISGPDYSDIYFTTDGSTPGKSSNIFTERLRLSIPENKNAGSLIIKAKAVSLNGKTGNVISKIFTYDTQKPDVPDVKIVQDNGSGLYGLEYNDIPGVSLYYRFEDSSRDFYEADPEDFLIDIPEGTERDFSFIFCCKRYCRQLV